LQSEKARCKLVEQKVVELELQLKASGATLVQVKEKGKEALISASNEGARQVEAIRLELKECSEKLSAMVEKNAALELQV
jgi:hypothetical protein